MQKNKKIGPYILILTLAVIASFISGVNYKNYISRRNDEIINELNSQNRKKDAMIKEQDINNLSYKLHTACKYTFLLPKTFVITEISLNEALEKNVFNYNGKEIKYICNTKYETILENTGKVASYEAKIKSTDIDRYTPPNSNISSIQLTDKLSKKTHVLFFPKNITELIINTIKPQ